MSELGNTLRALRGDRSQREIAQACGLNLRTIQRAELGDDLRLSTLRTLAARYGLGRGDYANLLIAWLRMELGEDFSLLAIKSKVGPGRTTQSEAEKFVELFRSVPSKYQRELVRAVERQEVLRSIAPLNDLYDSLTASHHG